jgi:hypothetical protein
VDTSSILFAGEDFEETETTMTQPNNSPEQPAVGASGLDKQSTLRIGVGSQHGRCACGQYACWELNACQRRFLAPLQGASCLWRLTGGVAALDPRLLSVNPSGWGRIPKPESPDPQDPKAEARNPNAEGRNPNAEGRNPNAEGRNPNAELSFPFARESEGECSHL